MNMAMRFKKYSFCKIDLNLGYFQNYKLILADFVVVGGHLATLTLGNFRNFRKGLKFIMQEEFSKFFSS